ncbi:hypothetical protein FXO38_22649 [Capsicum annuum]|nr:hypothetical protein FXO38_22649 [Capsicum annuum]
MWYVLTWPPTFCLKLRPPAQCIKPIRDHEFTLHGLWPADANGKTITCNITVPVDWDKLIRPRESRLKTFWPELKENQPKYSIWKHEWEKHGVCGLTTAEQYFDAAIRTNGLFTRGNLYNYLASSSIVSSDHVAYTQDDIIKAIQTVFAPAPALGVYLRCTAIDSTNTTHGYLSEAVVCTTMDGSSFVTCPPRARNCDKFPHIVIPPRPPRRRESQSMGQRMLRFDFVSRDPPQVGFESRVMGDYPVRTVRRELLVCASRGLIFHQATIHFYPYIGLDLRGAAVTLEGVQGVELSEIMRKDGFINSTSFFSS